MFYFTFMGSDQSSHLVGKTAMEKVAWLELLVSLTAISVTLILIPFFGHGASSAFVLLIGVVCSFWFLRNRTKRIVMDERDHEIEYQARRRGIESAWWFLLLALIVAVMWPLKGEQSEVVRKTTLNWLIWIQFALFFGVKGLVGVILYRRQAHAS